MSRLLSTLDTGLSTVFTFFKAKKEIKEQIKRTESLVLKQKQGGLFEK
jgi:hypothetical protein